MSKVNQIGKYSVTSIDFNSWFDAEQNVKVVPKNKKLKNKKKIVYPIFLEYSTKASDIFWVKKFNLLANGKMPKYFSVTTESNYMIIHYIKPGTNVNCVLDKDVVTNTKNCIQFFKDYAGIFSKNNENDESDVEVSSDLPSEITEPDVKTWAQYNKKMQELMIKNYTNELIDMMNLNNKEANLLLQTLKLSLSAKNFNKSNIVIDQGKITLIKDLLWDENTKMFKIDIASSKSTYKKISEDSSEDDIYVCDMKKDMIPQFNQKIKKYYELYDKKYIKYNKNIN